MNFYFYGDLFFKNMILLFFFRDVFVFESWKIKWYGKIVFNVGMIIIFLVFTEIVKGSR